MIDFKNDRYYSITVHLTSGAIVPIERCSGGFAEADYELLRSVLRGNIGGSVFYLDGGRHFVRAEHVIAFTVEETY